MVDLCDVSSASISFTYEDSLLAFDETYHMQSGERYQSTLCGRVFCMDELAELSSHPEFRVSQALHIEAQLWIIPRSKIVKALKHSFDLQQNV